MALKLNQPDNARDWLDLAFDALKDFEPSHDKAMNLIQVGLGYQQLRASMPAMNAPLAAARGRRAAGSGDRGRASRRREDALLCRWLSRSLV